MTILVLKKIHNKGMLSLTVTKKLEALKML